MNKLKLIFIFFLICQSSIINASTGEKNLYNRIIDFSQKGEQDKALALSKVFIRKYPKSTIIPDVRLLQADYEKNPKKAIKNYEYIFKSYKKYSKRDHALFMACQISYLISDWEKLHKLSLQGIINLKFSKYKNNYRLYFILSNTYSGDYEIASKECLKLIDQDRNYERMAHVLLILSYINKKKSGYSKDYILNLRDISAGYKKSDVLQTVIFLLGDFYEKKGYYNRSYSAYTDLIKKYPNSPEASFAQKRLEEIIKLKPKKTKYFPDMNLINQFDSIDLSPYNEENKENKKESYYSISIGPFNSLKEAKKIKDIIKGFNYIKTVKLKNDYNIFLEKVFTIENALKVKIRLAEEYGINGQIIRISNVDEKKYIYRE